MRVFIIAPLLSFIIIAFPFAANAQYPDCNNNGDENKCLICNCYREAGNQRQDANRDGIVDGKLAVTLTVLQRQKMTYYPRQTARDGVWPDTYCGVVFDPYQYSWTIRASIRRQPIPNDEILRECSVAVDAAKTQFAQMQARNEEYPSSYLADYASAGWAKATCAFQYAMTIGTHLFYWNKEAAGTDTCAAKPKPRGRSHRRSNR